MGRTETSPARYEIASHPHWIDPNGVELAAPAVKPPEGPFIYGRMLRRLPAPIRESLTREQLAAISDALIPDPPTHAIDYRVSVPFFGKRFYITLLAGRERRSLARLAREAQLRAKHIAMFYSVILLFLGCVSVIGLALLGYVTKSALDIDLMDGPSFLHQFFFPEQQSAAGPLSEVAMLMERIPRT